MIVVRRALRSCAWLALLGAGCRIGFDAQARATDDAGGDDAATPGDGATVRANRVFLTAETTGDLGGIAGADATCRAVATQNQLSGTFFAMLVGTARPDLAPMLAGSRGWQLVDGTWVADRPTEAATEAWLRPIDMRADGTRSTNLRIWTGIVEGTCNEWSTASALVDGDQRYVPQYNRASDGHWPCSDLLQLECIEVGNVVPLVPPAITHPLVFVSSGAFAPNNNGRATADAMCQSEATAAGLAGAFAAVLPVDTAPAIARFADVDYQTPNGTLVGQLGTGLAYIITDATGAIRRAQTWNGGDPRVATAMTCGSWTSTMGMAIAAPNDDGHGFGEDNPVYYQPCGSPNMHVFCAQR